MKLKAPLAHLFLALVLVLGGNGTPAAQRTASVPEPSTAGQGPAAGASRYGELLVGELLNDIEVPGEVSDLMSTLYTRHRSEILRIVNANPQLVWSTVDLVIDALPALRAVEGNGGALIVERKIYSKAEGVLGQYKSLASAKLAKDLDGLKYYVDSRIVPLDSERLKVDLN